MVEIDNKRYMAIVAGKEAFEVLEKSLKCQDEIDETISSIEHLETVIANLMPWRKLGAKVEEIRQWQKTNIIAGIMPRVKFEEVSAELNEMGAVIEIVDETKLQVMCLVVSLNENAVQVTKILRGGDFENANFEKMQGTVSENIETLNKELGTQKIKLVNLKEQARELAKHKFDLNILSDHYNSLHNREETGSKAPATKHVVLLEGWIRKKDFKRLEKIVHKFAASNISEIKPGEGEETPIEIENNAAVKPFETITRLNGMPGMGDIDPTVYMAPFFAVFFGICVTDAGYGLVMAVAFWWLIRKIQGDKKALWMFLISSTMAIVAGAVTGSWFGDAHNLIPQDTEAFRVINGWREKIMLFDPMKDPMTFFMIAMGLGYFQIMCALMIGFFNNLFRKNYAAAVFSYLVWLIYLNSLMIFGLSKAHIVPSMAGSIAGWIAVSQAAMIFWFTERNSGLGGRIGGGVFALFSTVFYFGDLVSYVRLMALGMVSGGLGMAVNTLVKLVMEIPYAGFVLGLALFVVGHLVNTALAILGSFVHSLRLQFVEFFPKFFTGGGTEFKPFSLSYKHMIIKEEKLNKA
jgi:V/A-type H+-transporting ATPase subunit I